MLTADHSLNASGGRRLGCAGRQRRTPQLHLLHRSAECNNLAWDATQLGACDCDVRQDQRGRRITLPRASECLPKASHATATKWRRAPSGTHALAERSWRGTSCRLRLHNTWMPGTRAHRPRGRRGGRRRRHIHGAIGTLPERAPSKIRHCRVGCRACKRPTVAVWWALLSWMVGSSAHCVNERPAPASPFCPCHGTRPCSASLLQARRERRARCRRLGALRSHRGRRRRRNTPCRRPRDRTNAL